MLLWSNKEIEEKCGKCHEFSKSWEVRVNMLGDRTWVISKGPWRLGASFLDG